MSTPDARTPRVFYYEDAVNSYVPIPDKAEDLFDWTCLDDGEEAQVTFRVVHMTDAEFAALPEV